MVNNTNTETKSGISKWLNKEGSAYAFISMYALMFIIFIVVPVLVAFILSFTFFDTIQFPSFNGLKNYIVLITQDDIYTNSFSISPN